MAGYTLTRTAEDELQEILRFIAEDSGVERALVVHEKLADAFETLAASPEIGFRRRELTGDRIRWWPVFRLLIIYDPETEPLTVLRVIHGAREVERLFRRE